MFAPWRIALVMLGMYSLLEFDCSAIFLTCRSFAARFSPISWLWLNPLSLNLPMSLISAAVNVADGRAELLPASTTASAEAANRAANAPAQNRFLLKKLPSSYGRSGLESRVDANTLRPLMSDETRPGGAG